MVCKMRILLLRHGIAENGRPGSPDSERELVPEGRKKLREVLKAAKDAGAAPDLILTSPYRRAVETAEIAASVIGYAGELVHAGALTPDASPAEVWTEIRAQKHFDEILLVGHEPLFSHLMAYLLGAPSLLVDFKKGALACVDIEHFSAEPHGILRWFLTPKLAGA